MEGKDVSKKVVLAVDDDALVLKMYERIFESEGIQTLVARNGEEGLEMIKEHKPDFVVLDIRMPKLDGIEVLKRMRKDKGMKDTPVLILTNYDEAEYRETTEKLGALDFLVKTNVDPNELAKRVSGYLSK